MSPSTIAATVVRQIDCRLVIWISSFFFQAGVSYRANRSTGGLAGLGWWGPFYQYGDAWPQDYIDPADFADTADISVFLGHGNNIANSWLELAEKIPLFLTLACAPGYEPHSQLLQQAEQAGMSRIHLTADPQEAVRDADVIYTDVWPTGGRTDPGERRSNVFTPYQVNRRLLKNARRDCLVMHRLPANRGEEITGEVLDGKQSIVLQQAANRVHVQKAVMIHLLEKGR